MRSTASTLLVCALFLSACSSNLNPVNWFGRNDPDATLQSAEEDNPLIPEASPFARAPEVYQGTTIDTVSDLTIERVPGGIIIRATGQSTVLGAFNAQLTPLEPDETPVDGVLTYLLQAEFFQVAAGSPATREVVVGRQLTDQELGDTRIIRVEAVRNALERRR